MGDEPKGKTLREVFAEDRVKNEIQPLENLRTEIKATPPQNPRVLKEEKKDGASVRMVRGFGKTQIEIDDMEGFAFRMEKHLCEQFRERFRGTPRWPFVSQLTDEQISRAFCENMEDKRKQRVENQMRQAILQTQAQLGHKL